MNSMKGLFEGLGIAITILGIAISLEFCNRPDKAQGPGQWFGCCPHVQSAPAEAGK